MRRLFKWLGISVLVFLFLGAIALGTAYYYKSDILALINRELRKNINGDFQLGGVTFSLFEEFPGLSITLHDLHLQGPQYARYGKDFFTARKIYLNLRLGPLLKKTIVVRSVRISDGAFFIFRTQSGYTNRDIFKKTEGADTAKSQNPVLVLFSNVRLDNVQFSFQDSLKKKSIGFTFVDLRCGITQSDSSSSYTLTGPMNFEGLMLNPDNGSYLKGKSANVHFELEFKPAIQELILHPSTMEFTQSKVNVSGNFGLGPPGKLILNVSSDQLVYDEGISLLTQALRSKLEKIKIEKPIHVVTRVVGQFSSGAPPAVDVSFRFSDSHLQAYSIQAERATTEGLFSNHVDSLKPYDDYNSMVKLNRFEGAFQGLTTQLTATLRDLKDPRIELTSSMEVKLHDFKNLVDSTTLPITGGTFSSRVEYKGRLNEFLDSTKTTFKGELRGSARIKDGAFRYVPRNHIYQKVNCSVTFDQRHVTIEGMSLMINKNLVYIKGVVHDFVPFFVLPEKRVGVNLNVYSPAIDLAFLLSKDTTQKAVVRRKEGPKKKMTELIDNIADKIEFNLAVKLDKLSYKNMKGSNVNGRAVLTHNLFQAQDFTMNLAEGEIAFSLSLADLQKSIYPLSVASTVHHADIKKFFYAFDNFKQTTVTHENLEGLIDMTAVFRSNVDENFSIAMPTVYGDLEISIRDGKLLNFEPLQNMSNFLLKKRDFNNVQFGEIKSHLTIRSTEIDVRRMEIESNVLRLFVEGNYSLKNNTNLEVQVPLSNLKKRDKDYKPENVGLDSKVGPSVFLHVYNDEEGKTVIAYDPFKKHAKKSNGKEATTKKKSKKRGS